MPKPRKKRMSVDWEKVARLLIAAIEPVAKLIEVINH
jgi:hypothetical protein